jgi:hypothetical protein
MKHIAHSTETYQYHFTVTDHGDGTKTLKVQSQWVGSKESSDLQTCWQATLNYEDWVELTALLL